MMHDSQVDRQRLGIPKNSPRGILLCWVFARCPLDGSGNTLMEETMAVYISIATFTRSKAGDRGEGLG